MSNELTFTDLQDAIEKAQILFNEELYVDAKKILRKVLIIDPDQSEAKALLSEIQKIELDHLMDQTKGIKKYSDDINEKINVEEVIMGLEKTVKVKIIEENKGDLSFFQSDEIRNDYKNKLLKNVKKLNDRELLDLSIAFYEMELFELSIIVLDNISSQSNLYLSAQILNCKSLIALNKPIEAIVKLEGLLKKSELTELARCNINYLLGTSYEKLKDSKRANEYFRYVYQLNPRFKDVMEKLK